MIDVPKANPILFRPLTGQTDVNFDNTFEDNNKAGNKMIRPFAQYITDTMYIMAVSDTNYYSPSPVSCDLVLYAVKDGVNEYCDFQNVYYNASEALYYYVWKLQPIIATGCMKLRIGLFSTSVDYFESEWVHIPAAGMTAERAANPNLFKVEWFNAENAFSMDYVLSGFVSLAYVEGKFTYQAPGGDVTVFDNLGSPVKLRDIVQRVLKFEVEAPAYLCEQLTIAMAHDFFFINDVQFVTEKKPAITQMGSSNIFKLEAELLQGTVIGVNTHDTGYTVDTSTEVIMNVLNSAKTASFTADIPAGYLLHIVTITRTAGSGTVACGTTAGGTDIFAAQTVDGTTTTVTVECHDDFPIADVLYFTITGTVTVTVNCQLIKSVA